ncbi:hypothetical protein HY086_05375 [Candidatus Gottesmanbacteria bacterium]|nr:hypothetical protein [Candidatus Gottesmanbacteria bacterium]
MFTRRVVSSLPLIMMAFVGIIVVFLLVMSPGPTPRPVAVASTVVAPSPTAVSPKEIDPTGDWVDFTKAPADVNIGGIPLRVSAEKMVRAMVTSWIIRAAWFLPQEYEPNREVNDTIEIEEGEARIFNFCARKNPTQCVGPITLVLRLDSAWVWVPKPRVSK